MIRRYFTSTTATTTISGLSEDLLITLSMNHGNSGNTHEELVNNLRRNGLITCQHLYNAFLCVDRRIFCTINVDGDETRSPYDDKPQDIGYGASISSPHMHALALQSIASRLTKGCQGLDVGCGNGYVTTVMAQLCDGVIGVDIQPQLVSMAEQCSAQCENFQRVQFCVGSVLEMSTLSNITSNTAFDCAHIGVAIPYSNVTPLLNLLKDDGMMVAPLETGDKQVEQRLSVFSRSSSSTIDSYAPSKTLATHNDTKGRVWHEYTIASCIYSNAIVHAVGEESSSDAAATTTTTNNNSNNEDSAPSQDDIANAISDLKRWQGEFKKRYSRPPSAAEIHSSDTWQTYAKLKKLQTKV